jgi:hypothetical protein
MERIMLRRRMQTAMNLKEKSTRSLCPGARPHDRSRGLAIKQRPADSE